MTRPDRRRTRTGISQKPKWQITVLATDGRQLFHAVCEDRKEAAGYATEARHSNSAVPILITDPYGDTQSWD